MSSAAWAKIRPLNGCTGIGRKAEDFERWRQIDQQALSHVFTHRVKIVDHVVDKGDGEGPFSVQGSQHGSLGILGCDHRITECQPVEKPAAHLGMPRRHGCQENEVGIRTQRMQAVNGMGKRRLPGFLIEEEVVDQGFHRRRVDDAFVRCVDDVAGQFE